MIALLVGIVTLIVMMATFPDRAERILLGGGALLAIMHMYNMRNSNII